MQKKYYDYIILGAGLSGLMLAYRFAQDPFFKTKQILILDKDLKTENDRTWCYWHKGKSEWDAIVSKKWDSILFESADFSKEIPLSPYTYNKIESESFYAFCKSYISQAENITFKLETFKNHKEVKDGVEVVTQVSIYTTTYLFTSIFPPERLTNQTKYPVLKQHFKGWFIKAKNPVFNPKVATFMDFKIPQKGNTRFMYVLPTSPTEALVEYTLFSHEILSENQYETAIQDYLEGIDYKISSKENGIIPMTAYPFSNHNTKRVLHIGTAGGWTRGSTGYTFTYTTQLTSHLITFLKTNTALSDFTIANRFTWYDKLFLDVLHRRNELGAELFTAMFAKNEVNKIFRFLDGKTSLQEDLQIIWSLPAKREFIKSFLKVGF